MKVIASNVEQLKYKGKGELYLYDESLEHYVIYPGIGPDFHEIGNAHKSLNQPKVALSYYTCALFYGSKTGGLDQEREDVIKEEIKRISVV